MKSHFQHKQFSLSYLLCTLRHAQFLHVCLAKQCLLICIVTSANKFEFVMFLYNPCLSLRLAVFGCRFVLDWGVVLQLWCWQPLVDMVIMSRKEFCVGAPKGMLLNLCRCYEKYMPSDSSHWCTAKVTTSLIFLWYIRILLHCTQLWIEWPPLPCYLPVLSKLEHNLSLNWNIIFVSILLGVHT